MFSGCQRATKGICKCRQCGSALLSAMTDHERGAVLKSEGLRTNTVTSWHVRVTLVPMHFDFLGQNEDRGGDVLTATFSSRCRLWILASQEVQGLHPFFMTRVCCDSWWRFQPQSCFHVIKSLVKTSCKYCHHRTATDFRYVASLNKKSAEIFLCDVFIHVVPGFRPLLSVTFSLHLAAFRA